MADNSGQIATTPPSPRRAGSDGVSAEQHDIPGQIKADQYAGESCRVGPCGGGQGEDSACGSRTTGTPYGKALAISSRNSLRRASYPRGLGSSMISQYQ